MPKSTKAALARTEVSGRRRDRKGAVAAAAHRPIKAAEKGSPICGLKDGAADDVVLAVLVRDANEGGHTTAMQTIQAEHLRRPRSQSSGEGGEGSSRGPISNPPQLSPFLPSLYFGYHARARGVSTLPPNFSRERARKHATSAFILHGPTPSRSLFSPRRD